MPEKWTGEVVGIMHNARITNTKLAEELGVTKSYIGMVLNGHRAPEGAEEKFRSAIDRIIIAQQADQAG
jgi:hypothetical protein